ncbi:MAG: C-terminal helicase domain-containing protein, partial [Bacteroidia bacterium]|nr:C-terminal helicase domain-containing protein [Bacteroidia bacterium]
HIRAIERLVFPSVLEMLQEGVPKLKEKHVATVLSEGLPQKYKNAFFTMLKYQHRMHEDIARLPSQAFYGGESLLTPAYIRSRPWGWRSHEPRVSWVPIKAINPKRPIHNPEEAEKIMRILQEILNSGQEMEIAILSFYLDQVRLLRRELRKLTKSNNFSRFDYGKVRIYLYTVDKFQGQEADVVLLSFVKFSPFAHYTSPNRLNVALTRARHKLILFGAKEELRRKAKLPALRELASLSHVINL